MILTLVTFKCLKCKEQVIAESNLRSTDAQVYQGFSVPENLGHDLKGKTVACHHCYREYSVLAYSSSRPASLYLSPLVAC